MRGSRISTDANRAMSGTERAKPPTVSSDSARLDAGARNRAESGLEADDAAIRGRTDDGAGGLRAQRERHHVVGHRRGRAAGRTAGRMGLVARIARGPAVGGEFGGDGLADHDRAGASAQRHRGGIQAGMMAFVDGRAVARAGRRCRTGLSRRWASVQRTAQRALVELLGIQRRLLLQRVQAWMVFSRCSMRAKQARTNCTAVNSRRCLARRVKRAKSVQGNGHLLSSFPVPPCAY